jgi:transaldolase
MDAPVDARIVQSLQTHFEDFRRAYDPQGMRAEDFDAFGATRRTLRAFIEGYHELVAMVRDFMIEDPDR